MSMALPILLLLLFVLAFWLIKESKVSNILKVAAISLFFGFCGIFWYSFDSYMGWSAKAEYLPEVVTIRAVVIQEPKQQDVGGIYLLIQHPTTRYTNLIFRTFGYNTESSEPRLYHLPYSRDLHEQLQKDVIPSLQKGQSVTGKFQKGGQPGNAKGQGGGDGKGGGKGGKAGKGQGKGSGQGGGGGSESLHQEMMFYKLEPSYFQKKDYNRGWQAEGLNK